MSTASDSIFTTADQSFKTVGTSLGDSYNFLLGKFRFPGYMGPDPNNVMRLGTDIRYAMSFPMENGGRRIVIITPRVIGFQEARNQPRTVDYPFSLFEMRFGKDGKGEGRLAYATQISFDKKKNSFSYAKKQPTSFNPDRSNVKTVEAMLQSSGTSTAGVGVDQGLYP